MSFLTTLSAWLVMTLEPYGPPGLMVIAIADSSFLSLPEVNDAALMALSISNPSSMVVLAAMTVIGSVIGCSLLYAIGRKGGEALLNRRFAASKVQRIRAWYQKYGMLAVIIPSLLPPPLPFKIFVLSAGAFRIPWMRFVAAVAIGRSVRYFTEGILAVMFGRQAIQMVAENSGRVGVLLAVLAIVGVLVFAYIRRHKVHASMVILPLAVTLMASGCIVRTTKIPEGQRLKPSNPFTTAQAFDRLRQMSSAVQTLQTQIGLTASMPSDTKEGYAEEYTNLTGQLILQRPNKIYLSGGVALISGFEMSSNGTDFEVYIPRYKQVHTGRESDRVVKSNCDIKKKAEKLITMRPRKIMDALVPDFRTLLDSASIAKPVYSMIQDQTRYVVVDFIDVSRQGDSRILQKVFFDTSLKNVDVVRRVVFDAEGSAELDIMYKDMKPIGSSLVPYPMKFEVRFVPTDTLLNITYLDPESMKVNTVVSPDTFDLGTHKSAEVCRMDPVASSAR